VLCILLENKMKFLLKLMFVIIYVQICENSKTTSPEDSSNLEPSSSLTLNNQCEKVSNYLEKVIMSNKIIHNGVVNIAVADYSKELDTSCILRNLQEKDYRVVINSFKQYGFRYRNLNPDYFILLEDFPENVRKF